MPNECLGRDLQITDGPLLCQVSLSLRNLHHKESTCQKCFCHILSGFLSSADHLSVNDWNTVMEKLARVTYTNALRWPPLCKKTSFTITFKLRHLGWRFWCLDLCFWGQGIRWCHLFGPMTFQGHDLCKITFLGISQFLIRNTLPNFNTR